MQEFSNVQQVGSEEIPLADLLEVVRRRRVVALVAMTVCLAVGLFYATRPRHYAADGELRIQPGAADAYRVSPINLLSGQASDKIASEVSIIQSRTLYLRVAGELDLANDPGFTGHKPKKHQSLDDPVVREGVFRQMRNDVKVVHNPKDEIISITCSTFSPALSAKLVNTIINDYVEYIFQMRFGASKRASGWLIKQLDDLKQQIEHDQTSLTDLQSRLGIIGLDDKDSDYLLAQSLNAMTKASSEATLERIVAEAKVRFLQDSDPGLIEGEINLLPQTDTRTAQNGLLATLRNSKAQIAANYAQMSAQFGANYPDVKQLKAQLDEITRQEKAEEQRILNQAKLSYSAASANERMTDQALQQKKTEAFAARGDMVKYIILLHDYESHRKLYEGLVLRLREAGITSGMEAGDVDIVDLADLPTEPAPPGRLIIMAGALLAGIVIAYLSALLFDALDTRITTVEQAERNIQGSLLAVLPHIRIGRRAAGQSKTGEVSSPISPVKSQYHEAIQSLRSSILLARPGSSPQVILITSGVPGEGKSTTALNLGVIFAQHHARTLLIDCDLRRGSVDSRLGIRPTPGLTNVLTGQASLQDAIQDAPGGFGLKLLVGGPRPPDPAVLVASAEMGDLLKACKAEFDIIILDCPPVLGISDTMNLSKFSEAIILIVRSRLSRRKAVRNTSRTLQLAQGQVLGFVINDLDPREQGYGYGSEYLGYYGTTGQD